MGEVTDRLTVVAVGPVDDAVTEQTASALYEVLGISATIVDEPLPLEVVPDDAFDDSTGQYDAPEFAEAAFARVDADCCLVVTDQDLTYARREYVFGVGFVDGGLATFSTYRLDTSPNVPVDPDDDVFVERVRKEAVVQVGRLLGIESCSDRECVFSFSPTVRELDLTDEVPCEECDRAIRTGRPRGGATEWEERDRDELDDGPAEPESVSAITHDLYNTGRFVSMIVGFVLSFVVSLLVLVRVAEVFFGPLASFSDQLTWALLAATLVVAYYVYRKARRLTGRLLRRATGRSGRTNVARR